jgi:hypothetical protein
MGDAAMELHLTYDATTDVAYLDVVTTGPADVLGPTLLLETDPSFRGAVAADFKLADGRLVGLEFRFASACLPAAWLADAERIDGDHVRRRFVERVERRLQAGPPRKAPAQRTH